MADGGQGHAEAGGGMQEEGEGASRLVLASYGYGRLVVCIKHASARVDEDGKRVNAPIPWLRKLRKYTMFVYVLLFMAGCIT
jgi:hypothetical protein